MESSARYLVFHGAIVLLVGLLCGAPYGRAVVRNAPPHIVNSWRVAHSSLPMGAVLMFAAATLFAWLAVSANIKSLLAIMLIVCGYAFCVSLPLAAITGHRGLSNGGPVAARIVFMGNTLGAATSLIAALILVYAAFVSL